MSINISSFSPQSSGGGGTFVLKCVDSSSISAPSTKTFSASYGGVVYAVQAGSDFNIQRIDGVTLSTNASLHLVGTGSYNNIPLYTHIIPFGSSCTLKGTSGSTYYELYKYELIQS